MAVQTSFNPQWLIQVGLLSLLGIAALVWGAYDGFVAYPQHNQAVDQYEKLMTEQGEDAAQAFAAEQGWESGSAPERKSDFDIMTQYVIMVAGAVMIVFGLVWIVPNLSKPSADDEAVRLGSARVPYSAITDIDKALWEKKGIAVVHYDHGGRKGVYKLDDWKHRGAAQILDEIEKRRGRDEQAVVEDAD